MNILEPYECSKCGHSLPPSVVYAGPHVKAICGHCGAYIQFYPISKLPDVKNIKLKIFSMENNIEEIWKTKADLGFVEGMPGYHEKMQYINLHLKIYKQWILKQRSQQEQPARQ